MVKAGEIVETEVEGANVQTDKAVLKKIFISNTISTFS